MAMGFCWGDPERKNQSKTERIIEMITEKAMETMQQRPAMIDLIADFRGNKNKYKAKVESRLLWQKADDQ